MFNINWSSIGNYTSAIVITAAIILGIFHFMTKGRMWKTFNEEQYKCGVVQLLSSEQVPNLTGIYSTPLEASSAVLKCNSPQAFKYDSNLCTLDKGKYSCFPEVKDGKQIS